MEEGSPAEIRARIQIHYRGPVAPHWEVRWVAGDKSLVDDFSQRIYARMLMLPPHDPQYRRNRERIMRDAEREGVAVSWDIDQ